MNAESIKFRDHPCFKTEWSGFDAIKPITVIIGRNNTGKSHLLDLVRSICDGNVRSREWEVQLRGKLEQGALVKVFTQNEHTSHGQPMWVTHGVPLLGALLSATYKGGNLSLFEFPESPAKFAHGLNPRDTHEMERRKEGLNRLLKTPNLPLHGRTFHRLFADRNILPEAEQNDLRLDSTGAGATNIVRRYLTSTARKKLPRELITHTLLKALNEVFGSDGHFTEIEAQHHDEQGEFGQPVTSWEIYLAEEKKGLIPLTRSGSGLKTVLLVLLFLLIVPEIEGKKKDHYVFAFEELENNLHPALLRRLLRYIENYVQTNDAYVFLTTHSSVTLDVFQSVPSAQIIHVSHDGSSARTRTVDAHFDRQTIVSELGAKPSDLLQANGVIWVEGPSDRLYLNRWIELAGKGEFQEGRDYVCAFYGGALLARVQFAEPAKEDARLTNLLRLNGNFAVICDSDRASADGDGSELKARVQRVAAEVGRAAGAPLWITVTREIENYLPGAALAAAYPPLTPRDPGQFEDFFSSTGTAKSYLESELKLKTPNKVELAELVTPNLTLSAMESRFDWSERMTTLIEAIRRWNA